MSNEGFLVNLSYVRYIDLYIESYIDIFFEFQLLPIKFGLLHIVGCKWFTESPARGLINEFKSCAIFTTKWDPWPNATGFSLYQVYIVVR